MKILFILKLYTGFEASLEEGCWRPSGAPTIARLLDGLCAHGDNVTILFTTKGNVALPGGKRGPRRIDGLDADLVLVPDLSSARWLPRRLRPYATELAQTLIAMCAAWRMRPDLIYVDRGNVFPGAFLARLGRRPVVMRVMGLHPMQRMLLGHRPSDRLGRWLWKSPFALSICTQDGSGMEVWLDRLIRPSVPREVLLNGVDRPHKNVSSRRGGEGGQVVVLFVGRFEPIKGPLEFIEGVLSALRARPRKLSVQMVGTGPLEQEIREFVARAGATDAVEFMSGVPQAEMARIFEGADIYVSLNLQGNLSNANLEAFTAGCCCIVPSSSVETGRDIYLDEIMPQEAVYRIAEVSAQCIADAVIRLVDDPEERSRRAARTAECAARTIGSWQRRVDTEVSILGVAAESRGA